MASLKAQRIGIFVHALLLVAAVCALLFIALKVFLVLMTGTVLSGQTPALIWVGTLIYIVSHGFRSLRLALLIGGWRIGLRQIVSFHFFTAAVSLAVPLKLGEIYRVTELSYLMGDFIRAVETIWWERIFDVLAIIVILIAVSLSAAAVDRQQLFDVAALSFGFLIVTILTFFVLPDNLRRLSVLIIRRYESRRSVRLLRGIDQLRRAILGAPRLVRAKVVSLTVLTALIWACELLCFSLVLRSGGQSSSSAPDALLGFLSVVTRGYTLLTALQSGTPGLDTSILTYLTVTQFPLVFIGLFWSAYYVTQQTLRLRVQFLRTTEAY